jgi:hypothetical protein
MSGLVGMRPPGKRLDEFLRAVVPDRKHSSAMWEVIRAFPFLWIICDDSKLDIIWAMSLCHGMGNNLQKGRLARTCVAGNQHGTRVRVMEIQEYR